MKKIIFSVVVAALSLTATNQVKAEDSASISRKTERSVDKQVKRDTLVVQGKCGMCKTRIEKAAKSEKGVSSASWNIRTKQLQIKYDPDKTSVEKISKAIAKVGHDTDTDKADKAIYDALPACCRYR